MEADIALLCILSFFDLFSVGFEGGKFDGCDGTLGILWFGIEGVKGYNSESGGWLE